MNIRRVSFSLFFSSFLKKKRERFCILNKSISQTVCGSLGTLLKVKVSSRGGTPHHKPEDPNPDVKQEVQEEAGTATTDEVMTVETSDDIGAKDPANGNQSGVQPKQVDLDKKMGSHLDKLDSLISKAENAQYSMQHQTKQMRKFLKK